MILFRFHWFFSRRFYFNIASSISNDDVFIIRFAIQKYTERVLWQVMVEKRGCGCINVVMLPLISHPAILMRSSRGDVDGSEVKRCTVDTFACALSTKDRYGFSIQPPSGCTKYRYHRYLDRQVYSMGHMQTNMFVRWLSHWIPCWHFIISITMKYQHCCFYFLHFAPMTSSMFVPSINVKKYLVCVGCLFVRTAQHVFLTAQIINWLPRIGIFTKKY